MTSLFWDVFFNHIFVFWLIMASIFVLLLSMHNWCKMSEFIDLEEEKMALSEKNIVMVIVVVMDWIDCLKFGESNKYWRKVKFQQVCDPESFMQTEEGGDHVV